MTLFEIIKITNGNLINGHFLNKKVGKLCIDSRLIEDNDVFVCIKGTRTDGNKYIDDVMGIASLIITENNITYHGNVPILKVNDVKKAIIKIGTYFRNKYIDKPLIAVTGSVGKTTTKELIAHILSKKYNVLKTDGNYNNNLGLPLMLSKLNDSYDVIILELGMNHKHEIEQLSKICKPNIAIITNIGTSHIGNLKSQKNIFKAKMEVTKYLKNGTLIVNGQDKYLKKIKKKRKYNVIKTPIVKKVKIDYKLKFKIDNQKINFVVPSKYFVSNIMLSYMTSRMMNLDTKDIVEKINTFKPLNKRNSVIKLNNNITIIDDTYNASYESVISSIDVLNSYKGRKLLILGDILETGKYSKKIHKKIEEYINKYKNIDVVTIGYNTRVMNQKNYKTNTDLIKDLKTKKFNDIVILIKGSRGMHLEDIKDYFIKTYSCK